MENEFWLGTESKTRRKYKPTSRSASLNSLSWHREKWWGRTGVNRPFAGSGHMVRYKLCWDANNTVGLPKHTNSYQSSPTFLCFGSPTALFACQHDSVIPYHATGSWKGLILAEFLYCHLHKPQSSNYCTNTNWVCTEAQVPLFENISSSQVLLGRANPLELC